MSSPFWRRWKKVSLDNANRCESKSWKGHQDYQAKASQPMPNAFASNMYRGCMGLSKIIATHAVANSSDILFIGKPED